MTMIISAHLGDCVLIAADKRAMVCDLETGNMRLFHDDEQKIRHWCRGAIATTGETVFLNRIMDYFSNFQFEGQKMKQMDVIHEEIERRILEGVPKEMLMNNSVIFSIFDGQQGSLYTIPMESFFLEFNRDDGVKIIRPRMFEIKPWTVDVSCFNLPPDMSSLQNFQRQLKSLSSFSSELEFIEYYTQELKKIFVTQAAIDPSITTSFDLYLQNCTTGNSTSLHVTNSVLTTTPTKKLNYWNCAYQLYSSSK